MPLRAFSISQCRHLNTWFSNRSSPILTKGAEEEVEAVAGDAAVEVTLTLANNNSNLLNNISQIPLPPQVPGQRPAMFSDVHLDYPPQYVPQEGKKSLSATTLQERERTPCPQNPTGEGKDSVFSIPTGGGKDSLFPHPTGGGKDSECTVSYCIYPRYSSKREQPKSGKQVKTFSASVEKFRRASFDSKLDCRRIQTTLQGVPKIVQDSLHNQRILRSKQTKCLVDCYSRLNLQRRNRHSAKNQTASDSTAVCSWSQNQATAGGQ